MKNKVLAILISFSITSLIAGSLLLVIVYPELINVCLVASTIFFLYQSYSFWLQKLNRKDKSKT